LLIFSIVLISITYDVEILSHLEVIVYIIRLMVTWVPLPSGREKSQPLALASISLGKPRAESS